MKDKDTAATILCLQAVQQVAERIRSGQPISDSLTNAHRVLDAWYVRTPSGIVAKDNPSQEGKLWPEKTGLKPNSTG